MLRRSPAPLWFVAVVAATVAIGARAIDAWLFAWPGGGDAGPPIVVAFWPIIALVAGAIWKGLEIAARVTLEILKWSVIQLWAFARTTFSALREVGKWATVGLRRGWDFFQATYEHVLKPAWQHFWRWFDRARKWLEDVLRPVFRWLNFVRKYILDFYTKYVRPVLDVIGIAQKVLRVLSSLGLEWARKLDDVLDEVQRRIDAPFRFALAKINEVINVVNRVVTLDGLLQRVALLRSIERDIVQVSRAWWNTAYEPVTDAERDRVKDLTAFPTPQQHAGELRQILSGTAGERSAAIEEHAADLRLLFRRLRDAA